MQNALPWMGLGLSSNASAVDVPHPYRLKAKRPELFDYLEYSAPLDLAQARTDASLFSQMLEARQGLPLLFHPVHLNLYGPTLESDEALAHAAEHVRAVGSPWVSNDVAWWHVDGVGFPGYLYVAPPLDAGGLEACVRHALHTQSRLPVPLLLENPAILAPRGPLHILDFMATLHARTGCGLLLDVGHLWSHALATKLPVRSGWDGFAWDRVVQLHLAGGVVTQHGDAAVFMDDHTQPVREELFELFQDLVARCTNLRAVTFEGDGHPDAIAAVTLERLRRWVPRAEPRPFLPWKRPEAPSAAPDVADAAGAWAVFDAVFGPEGVSSPERSVRRAVVVQALDETWPLTRALVLPRPEDVDAFLASAEFRRAEPLAQTFAAHVRRKLREQPDALGAMVFAFETWTHQQATAELRAATFPADLTELVWAARALRRHHLDRAWSSGTVEGGAAEPLRQIAQRAPQRPWRVGVRRRRGGIELVLLDDVTAAD